MGARVPAFLLAGLLAAPLALTADATAPAFSPPGWTVTARAREGTSGGTLTHAVDPGGARGGRVTVTPPPNLTIEARPARVVVRPGGEVSLTLAVARGPAFAGRVPIDVRNLPRGVRVLNIGLNGVLVTETQAERSITISAEPWVNPTERPFYAVGKAESAGTEHSSTPITLVVEPAAAAATASASASVSASGPR
jgi:hypothetical protein